MDKVAKTMISGNRYIRLGRWARPWITTLCNKERRRNPNRLPAKTEAFFLANCAWWNGGNSAKCHTRDNFHAKGSAAKCSTSVSLNSCESLMWSCSLRSGREPKCLCLRSRHARTLRLKKCTTPATLTFLYLGVLASQTQGGAST